MDIRTIHNKKEYKAALDEISGAARALRVLVEFLEAHPESLLRGKGPEK